MSKKELIVRELDWVPEEDLERLLVFLRGLREAHAETALAAESSLSKDWLSEEEEAAWAGL